MKIIKLIKQKDYPDISYITHTGDANKEDGKKTTVSSSGCGLCAGMMVVQFLTGDTVSIEDAISVSYNSRANHAIGTSMKLFAPALCKEKNLIYSISDDITELIACLESDGIAIAHVASYGDYVCTFSNKGHYIVVIGYDIDSNRVAILDPSFSYEKYDTDERRDRVHIDGEIVWVRKEQLTKDTEARSPGRYYLFWRKTNK